MMKRQNNIYGILQREGGFSLLETCLVLIILSLILTPLYGFLHQQQQVEEKNTEEKVNDRVVAAISAFVRENRRLPCPANPTLAVGSANFGKEDCPGVVEVGAAPNNVYIGALPTFALNLPFQTSVNTEGWKYRYAVTGKLTAANTYDGNGLIQIQDPGGNNYTIPAPFVVVNLGQDGLGAFNLQGGASATACTAAPAGAANRENCDNNATFREGMFSTVGAPTSATYFDDTLAYTFARGESSMWLVGPNAGRDDDLGTLGDANRIDIYARNDGNIGIGTYAGAATPTAKLEVEAGDIFVQNSGGGGNVFSKEVEANGEVTAEQRMMVDTRTRAPQFIYKYTY